MTDQLFPKPPVRMKQPTKDILREQLVLSAQAQIEIAEDADRAAIGLAAHQKAIGEEWELGPDGVHHHNSEPFVSALMLLFVVAFALGVVAGTYL